MMSFGVSVSLRVRCLIASALPANLALLVTELAGGGSEGVDGLGLTVCNMTSLFVFCVIDEVKIDDCRVLQYTQKHRSFVPFFFNTAVPQKCYSETPQNPPSTNTPTIEGNRPFRNSPPILAKQQKTLMRFLSYTAHYSIRKDIDR